MGFFVFYPMQTPLSSKIIILCKNVILYAEFHVNVLKTDIFMGIKIHSFFSQIVRVKKLPVSKPQKVQ